VAADDLCFIDVAAVAISYLVYPGYLDHGEPLVVMSSWRLLDGFPAYPAFDGPDLTSNIYGPITFLTHAVSFLLAGPGVASGKAASLAAVVAIPAVVFMTHKRRGLPWALAAAILAAGFILLGLPTSIWNRPDPFLALLVAFSVWAMNASKPGRPDWGVCALIGLCGGLAVGFKLHAGLYFVPVVLLFCQARGFRAFALIGAVGAVTIALPFAFEPFSLTSFAAWFPLVTAKKTVFWLVAKVLRYLVFYATPVLFFLAALRWANDAIDRAEVTYFGAFVVTVLIVLLAAVKPGSGWYYFFPFLAVVIDMIVRYSASVIRNRTVVLGGVAVLAAALVILSVPVQKRFLRALHWDEARQITAEIDQVMAAYPGATIQMGTGDSLVGYNKTLYKSLLVFAGHPYTLDVAVAMETTASGVALSKAVRTSIENCHTQVWVVPAGEFPFAMTGYYGNPVFDERFKDAFRGSYAKHRRFRYFDTWMCGR